jgi:hypothetical protein
MPVSRVLDDLELFTTVGRIATKGLKRLALGEAKVDIIQLISALAELAPTSFELRFELPKDRAG